MFRQIEAMTTTVFTRYGNWKRWAALETCLLKQYTQWWHPVAKRHGALWLHYFNKALCRVLICFYVVLGTLTGYPKRPPVFQPWYVKWSHNIMRGVKKNGN